MNPVPFVIMMYARFFMTFLVALCMAANTAGVAYGEQGERKGGGQVAETAGAPVVQNVLRERAVTRESGLPESHEDTAEKNFLDYVPAAALVALLVGVGIPIYRRWEKKHKDRLQEKRYRSSLHEELCWIRMPGLPGGIESIQVNLDDDTFVQLRFSESSSEGEPSMSDDLLKQRNELSAERLPHEIIQRAFTNNRRLLLVLGDPGAGKTTLLQYYALCALDQKRYRKLGFTKPPKVFYLPLRELTNHGSTLPENLSQHAKKWYQQDIDSRIIDKWLQNETVTSLVLLDGLDEISDTVKRQEACKWIDRVLTGFKQSRIVVTSRRTGYGGEDPARPQVMLTSDHKRASVQDFSREQQELFLKNWFNAAFLREERPDNVDEKIWKEQQLAKAKNRSDRIIAVLKEEKHKALRQLAAVPMILQLMALLWKNNEFLPGSRMELYHSVFNYMLELRDKQKEIDSQLSAERARKVLAPVALWMQEELKQDEADKQLMQKQMQQWLDTLVDRQYVPPTADDFCDHLVLRAGLLAKIGESRYVFRHKSFREYLASIELVKKTLRSTCYIDTLISSFGDPWWNEPMRFFIAQTDAVQFDCFMDKLVASVGEEEFSPDKMPLLYTLIEEAPQKKVQALSERLLAEATTASCQRVILDCLNAIGQPIALETLQSFVNLKRAKNSSVASRAEEVMLALLPAAGVTSSSGSAADAHSENSGSYRNRFEQYAEYIRIPGGSFRYSVTGGIENVSELRVARYPVTNKRYRAFISYLQSRKPEDEALNKFYRKVLGEIARDHTWDSGFSDYYHKGSKDLAGLFRSKLDEDRKFGGDDHPVVGVTWYAAKGYCLWLSLLESEGRERQLYRLPTDLEWEFAAAGEEGRNYPWGNEEPTPQRANFNENIGATTPVENYPEGATPEGLYDMAGNVWEWTNSWYDEVKKEFFSLRGGSWLNSSAYLSCSARDSGDPGVWYDDVGFRVVRPSHLL
ncbi:MAG: SUMF1/EgtB/PvdO family nonheme iron enzyme [Chlorobium sp.]|nr:SUMF1/EgtB/PvdO family nonheme iron enzyme [Chlorobium sp.]